MLRFLNSIFNKRQRSTVWCFDCLCQWVALLCESIVMFCAQSARVCEIITSFYAASRSLLSFVSQWVAVIFPCRIMFAAKPFCVVSVIASVDGAMRGANRRCAFEWVTMFSKSSIVHFAKSFAVIFAATPIHATFFISHENPFTIQNWLRRSPDVETWRTFDFNINREATGFQGQEFELQ